MQDTKQLDAHDALLLFAEAFDGADEHGYAEVCGETAMCRCSAAKALKSHGRITEDVFEQLQPRSCQESFCNKEDASRAAAWCRSEAAKLRPAETWNGRTAVRCYRDGDGIGRISAYASEKKGLFFDDSGMNGSARDESDRLARYNPTSLDPDAALAALAKSPNSQRKLREMFAANPVADVVPATRVRCWRSPTGGAFYAMVSETEGYYFSANIGRYQASQTPIREIASLGSARPEIAPARALDLLKDWPEGRERFLAYCREHPPEAPKVSEPTKVWTFTAKLESVLTEPESPMGTTVAPEPTPPVRTVADVLREMPAGQVFTRHFWKSIGPCKKLPSGRFLWNDGDEWSIESFQDHDSPHDDPQYGIILLPAAEPVEDTIEILNDPAAMKMLADSEADIAAGRMHSHEDVKREMEQPAGVVVKREWLAEVASVLTHCQVHWFARIKSTDDPNISGLWKVLGEMAGQLAADARRKAGG